MTVRINSASQINVNMPSYLLLDNIVASGYIKGDSFVFLKSKKEDKDQESIQSIATPDPGHRMGK